MTNPHDTHRKYVLFNARLCKTWKSLARELGCSEDEAIERANRIGVFSLPAPRYQKTQAIPTHYGEQ